MEDWNMHLKKITDGDDAVLKMNMDLVSRRSKLLLCGRYVCFRVFLECVAATASGIIKPHKERWLLIQLAPLLLLSDDIFGTFTRLVGTASSDYLEGIIRVEARKIKQLIPQPSPLFFVLDEAQALTKPLHYFRSDTSPANGQPVLSRIIQDWGLRKQNLIVSGTGLSMAAVERVDGSAVAKYGPGNEAELVRDVGGFDDVGGQQAYLKQYCPSSFLDTSKGKEIMSRVRYWLHGRFVFDAAL